MASGKKTKGRQKIEMKEIENQDARLITFSKRRAGTNKKLSEIITHCGAEGAFVAFSSSGKSYSFGHPSIETITNRFLGRENPNVDDNIRTLIGAHRREQINEVAQKYNNVLCQLGAEMESAKSIQMVTKEKKSLRWWDVPIHDLNHDQVLNMHKKLTNLRQMLVTKANERSAINYASSSLITWVNSTMFGINPFAPSGSGINSTNNCFRLGISGSNPETNVPVFASGLSAIDPGNNSFAPGLYNDNLTFFGNGQSQVDSATNYLAPSMDEGRDPSLNNIFWPQGYAPSQNTIFPHPGFGFGDGSGEF